MDLNGMVLKHVKDVKHNINVFKKELTHRAKIHDKSKLESPEKEIFREYIPKLKESVYGSDEYKKLLKGMNTGLEHHYEVNRHHPEHFKYGIDDMTLIDIMEMLSDWLAATNNHDTGDIFESLKINESRFNISPQLKRIMENTVKEHETELRFRTNNKK